MHRPSLWVLGTVLSTSCVDKISACLGKKEEPPPKPEVHIAQEASNILAGHPRDLKPYPGPPAGFDPIAQFMPFSEAGAPAPESVLHIDATKWGVAVPNSVKNAYVSYDSKEGRLYNSTITGNFVMKTDPAVGHPSDFIDLESPGWNITYTWIDSTLRRLYWVTQNRGTIRVIDIDTKKIVARRDADRRQGDEPLMGAKNDSSGWIWVSDGKRRAITGLSPDLTQEKVITGLLNPRVFDITPDGSLMYVFDSPSKGQGALMKVDMKTLQATSVIDLDANGMPGGRVVVAVDNDRIAMVGAKVNLVKSDGTVLWTSDALPGTPHKAVAVGDVLAITVPEAYADRPEGVVVLLDLATGKVRAQVDCHYEAEQIVGDAAHDRVFVGNAGDGSVDEVDTKTGKITSTIDVASTAEGVVIDPKGGDRFILDRLGGSDIYRWAKDGSLSLLGKAPWPVDIALDPDRDVLIAMAHYDAAFHSWVPTTGQERTPLATGCAPGHTDTIGDLAYDADSGIAAAVWPETGCLAVMDAKSNQLLWVHTIPELTVGPEQGPGKGLVAILGDRVYVAGGAGSPVVQAYGIKDGVKQAQSALPVRGGRGTKGAPAAPGGGGGAAAGGAAGGPAHGAGGAAGGTGARPARPVGGGNVGAGPRPGGPKGGPNGGRPSAPADGRAMPGNAKSKMGGQPVGFGTAGLNSFYADKAGHRLFLSGHVIDADTLEITNELDGVRHVFWADQKQLIAMENDDDKTVVLRFDAKSLERTGRWVLSSAQIIEQQGYFDPVNRKLYMADVPRAFVAEYSWPLPGSGTAAPMGGPANGQGKAPAQRAAGRRPPAEAPKKRPSPN